MTPSIVTYLWSGTRAFLPSYVNTLARMVKHHLPDPHRFICVTDTTKGFSKDVEVVPEPPAVQELGHLKTLEAAKFPSSYRRLWTFSEEAKAVLGDWVLLLDIDCLVVDNMRPLFRMTDDFVGWSVRPPKGCPPRFGGGTWLHKTGTRTHVYDRFIADPLAAMTTAREAGYRGSDQAWISYCLTKTEPHWPEPSGVYCVQDCRERSLRPQRHRPQFVRVNPRYRRPPPRITLRRTERLVVPRGAIIMHLNGSGEVGNKPWNSNDPVVVKHWRPFFDGVHAA